MWNFVNIGVIIIFKGMIYMNFFAVILEFLDLKMQTPTQFGWFHLLCIALTVLTTFFLCKYYKPTETDPSRPRKLIVWTALIVTLFEIYKQINYTFNVENSVINADYQWYAFPFQFCSTPMYVGLLVALFRKGKIHESLCAYLATYSVFAGAAVTAYTGDVFVETIGINIQTMVCHCSMIIVGIYLFYTGYVKLEHKTIIKALPVFSAAVMIACVLNEVAFITGLTNEHYFNMFYVSPHLDPHLPIYSLVQPIVPYPLNLIIYIAGFTAAAYIILLIGMLIKKICKKKKSAN